MPIYEYECSKHGRFEILHRRIEKHIAICPQCGGTSNPVVSAPAHFSNLFPASSVPVYTHDWRQIDELRNVPATRPPTPPEDLVRMGVLPNNADRFEPQMPRRIEAEALRELKVR